MLTVTPPLLGFCAYSGTGKTTLLTRLIPVLNRNGLKIGLVKHAHHEFDKPGSLQKEKMGDMYSLRVPFFFRS